MKKTPLFVLVGSVFSLGALLMAQPNYQETSAYFVSNEEYEDEFIGNSLNSSWSASNGASLEMTHSSLKLEPQAYEWGGHIVLTKYVVSKNVTISFDYEEIKTEGWFAISFGGASKSTRFHDAQGALIFFNGNTTVFDHADKDVLNTTGVSYPFSPLTGVSGNRKHIKIQLTRNQDKTYTAKLGVYDTKDNLLNEQDNIPFPCLDGYIGFNSNFCSAEIHSFKIENADEEIEYSDDFTNSTCCFPTGGSSEAEWNSVSFSEDELSIGKKNKLDISKIGSGATYTYPFAKPSNKDLDHLYTLNTTISLSGQDVGVETGIEIGKSEMNEQGYFFGVRRNTFGYSLVTYAANEVKETCIDSQNETASLEIQLSLDVYQDGTVEAIAGELNETVNVGNIEGYFGLFSRNHLGNAGTSGGMIKNFSYKKDSFRTRNDEDVSINFNGTKSEVDGSETFYEYFYDKDFWYTGSGVKQSMYYSDDPDGYLIFTNTGPSSCFGPRKKFSEAIVRFDVEIVSSVVPDGGIVGLQFGKSTVGTLCQNSPSIGLANYPNVEGNPVTNIIRSNCDFVPGYGEALLNESGQQYNALTKGMRYTFMYIIKNGTVSMSFKTLEEDESVLMTPRAVCELVDTDGFIAVFGSNGISFMLDNLSIVNLDHQVETGINKTVGEYQSTLRYDFSKDKDLSPFILNNAQIKNSSLKINDGGSLKLGKKVANNILRFKVGNIENSLRINDGKDLSIELVSDDTNYVLINDNGHTYIVYLNDDFVFDGATFEITKMANQLTIAVASGNHPIQQIYHSYQSFEIDADYSYGDLSFNSVDGFSTIQSISTFNLDSHVNIETRNYNPETDEHNPWPYRGEDEKKGCKGNVSSTIILAFGLIGVGLFIAKKTKEVR